jgi:KUP system potassium uptake protein
MFALILSPFMNGLLMQARSKNPNGIGTVLMALGIVFGDIGTSPLYAFQTAVNLAGAEAAIGIASLIIWTLVLVVSVKYLFLISKADYHGEGGVFALLALFFNGRPEPGGGRCVFACLMIFGASLLFGDGAITPAISVLSAVEGLATINPSWTKAVVPLTIAILVVLFLSQRFGTGRLSIIFGPVMLIWFFVLGALGIYQIALHPSVLVALNPIYGLEFLLSSGVSAWPVVGAVVLVVTGSEALYADLGHFGRMPILNAWQWIVFPALALNYLGQGALVARSPSEAADTGLFFTMLPNAEGRTLLVVLATIATIIASQALISGVFSLAKQAMDLGYLPRFHVRHTSATERGQIHIPVVNFILGLACIVIVLAFKSSASLAAAYGIAVTSAMAITSYGFVVMSRKRRGMAFWKAVLLMIGLMCLDLPLAGACLSKVLDGGYVPLLLAAAITTVMLTWRKGRDLVHATMGANSMTPEALGQKVAQENLLRTPGTEVFLIRQGSSTLASARVLEQWKRLHALPERIVLLFLEADWKSPLSRVGEIKVRRHEGNIWEVHATHGYMVEPDAPRILGLSAEQCASEFDVEGAIYIFSQEILLACQPGQMPRWQRMLFGFLSRNVLPGSNYLSIPPDRLVVFNWMLHLDRFVERKGCAA